MHDRFDHQILTATSANVSNACVARAQTLMRLLPERARCDALVDMYFETLEWIHHPIHVPSFNAWYRRLWEHGLASRHCVQQLALLFSVLCLAVHFGLDDKHDAPSHLSDSESEDHVFYQASYDALVASDYLGHHSLAVLQTLILQGLYLNNSGQTSTHHANLGLAIRIANAMGLSSLDSSQSQDQTLVGPSMSRPPRNQFEMEMGRRLYWSLVCQDCYTASSCNFTYSIQPNQIKTSVFSNLRDDRLHVHVERDIGPVGADQGPEQQRDSWEMSPTTASYHIAKIPFALTARKTVDMHNEDTLTHAAVLELEKENRNHYHALPDFLRLDKPEQYDGDAYQDLGWGPGNTKHWNSIRVFQQQMRWQRLFLTITLHNRILRLHRPYLTRAYRDITFQASKHSALTSARRLLSLTEEGRRMAFPGLRWWVVLVHIFTAAVALCIDVHFVNVYQTSSIDELQDHQAENIRLIHLAIDILQSASSRSRAASRALQIISTLFEQAQILPDTRRSKASRKRARRDDTDDGWMRHEASSAAHRPANTPNGDSIVPTQPAQSYGSESGATATQSFETWLGSDWMSLLETDASASLTPVTTDVLTADLLGAINAFVSSGHAGNPS